MLLLLIDVINNSQNFNLKTKRSLGHFRKYKTYNHTQIIY